MSSIFGTNKKKKRKSGHFFLNQKDVTWDTLLPHLMALPVSRRVTSIGMSKKCVAFTESFLRALWFRELQPLTTYAMLLLGRLQIQGMGHGDPSGGDPSVPTGLLALPPGFLLP